jgi:hypothetical protein
MIVYKIMVVPVLLNMCENLTVMEQCDRGNEMVNIIYLRLTAGHTPHVHK